MNKGKLYFINKDGTEVELGDVTEFNIDPEPRPLSSLDLRLLRGEVTLATDKHGNFKIPIDSTGAPFVRRKPS